MQSKSTVILIRFEQFDHGRDKLPVFSVQVDGDGVVTYEGTKFVTAVGKRSKKIDPQEVRRLAEKMRDGGFFTWADGNGPDWPMLPGAIMRSLSLTVDKQTRTLEFGSSQQGDERFPVQTIIQYTTQLQAILKIDDWV